MDEYFENLDTTLMNISEKIGIINLQGQSRLDDDWYWPRLARLSFFEKLFQEHRCHFLYEIQALSSQIHFGMASCFLYRDKISTRRGRPNMYNHRYSFMIESTIHCIYAYWNRVGLVLNTYLKKPKDIKRAYFANVVDQLVKDYLDLNDSGNYQWILGVKKSLNDLDRNELAHNNSLIMQNFLPKNEDNNDFGKLLIMPELLLEHNKFHVNEILNLVSLIEELEVSIAE